MPHKHTRKDTNKSDFNLPPTVQAKPLPAYTKASLLSSKAKSNKRKRTAIPGYGADDTPRAFARLLSKQNTQKPRSGLDDGNRKRGDKPAKAKPKPTPTESSRDVPRLLPGERISDFNARVDQSLPVSGLARKGRQSIPGVKESRTKTEKRMHKMYAAWREEDQKRKDVLEAAREEAEDGDSDPETAAATAGFGLSKKRRREIGESEEKEGDVWEVLKEKRGGRVALNDVAQAPLEIKVKPRERFKVKEGARVDVANVPKGAGSLKKREELGSARMEVIERYREMMGRGKV
nr:hypothetical protein B0A51_14291 [Rachicladosporium sp. CCFEE 5018]